MQLINYKGIFKKSDLQQCMDYSIEKNNDFFILDLKEQFHIEFIEFELTHRENELELYLSQDKKTWQRYVLDSKDSQYFLTFNNKVKYQFIKIPIPLNKIKKDDEYIYIYIRKILGLLVAARSDGFGARFMPILNAMYLAEYTGFKFGFVWKERGSTLTQYDDNILAGIHVSSEQNIFSKEFIKEFSYTNKLPVNMRWTHYNWTFDWLTNHTDHYWGNYIDYTTARKIFGAKVYRHYPRLWKTIKFAPHIQDIIDRANRVVRDNFPKKFIAIAIRSGDIVYALFERKIGTFLKAMPAEVAVELIEENLQKGEQVVLFGDDFTQLRELKKRYKVHIAEDYLGDNITEIERIMFEVVFMSNAKEIYSGGSSFAKVAAYIGLGREPKMFHYHYKEEQILNILQKHNVDYLHPLQKAHSLFCSAILCINLDKDLEHTLVFLETAFEIDRENSLYPLVMVYACLKKGAYGRAEKVLLECHFQNQDFLDSLSHCSFRDSLFYLVAKIQKVNIKHFPKLYSFIYYINNEFSKEILEYKDQIMLDLKVQIKDCGISKDKEALHMERFGTAKSRIQNQLSYQLGQAMLLNSKSLWGYIRMPYVLSYIADKHKRESKIHQEKIKKNPSLKFPLLESYPNYKEALKCKKHLSYRLGETLIKAHKSWWKGGYIKFLFEVIKIKSRYRQMQLINYKGIFKKSDLQQCMDYSIEKNNDFFILDLKEQFHIEFIEFELTHRENELELYLSQDKKTWQRYVLDSKDSQYFLTFNNKVKYQFIKIPIPLNKIKKDDEYIYIYTKNTRFVGCSKK